jgi:collagenase-like PrtC family protease
VEILCPLRALDEVDPLLEAGARQFYAGLDSAVLFGAAAAASPVINCRPWPGCNLETDEEMRDACTRIHQHGGALYLAFNWYSYRHWELDAILAFLDRHHDVDGVIVTDIALLDLVRVRHPQLRIVLSTVGQVQNGRAAEFFRRRGVSQIVLPRHLTLAEIAGLAEHNAGLAFEVFIKNQDCFFSQGACYYTHDKVFPAVEYKCSSIRRYTTSRPLTPLEVVGLRRHLTASVHSCGVCSVRELAQRGVAAVKIAGRELPLERKVSDVRFLRRAVDALEGMEQRRGARTFETRVRALYREIYGEDCRRDCMY